MIRIEALQFRDPRRLLAVLLCAALLVSTSRAGAQDRYQLLHEFTGDTSPSGVSSLLQTVGGAIYGTSNRGGADDGGALFKVAPDGSFSVLHSFERTSLYSSLLHVQARDGSVYGSNNADGGTIFRVTPDGAFSVFATGVQPKYLVESGDGNLYGLGLVTNHPESFFKVAGDGTVTVLHEFVSSSDGQDSSSFIQATDGNFYGTNTGFGAGGRGTLFKLTADGSISILHVFDEFTVNNGKSLVEGPSGALFGIGQVYIHNHVVIVAFRLTSAGDFAVIHTFLPDDGYGGSIVDFDGAAFHVVFQNYDASGGLHGTWFRMTPDGAVTKVTSFDGHALTRGRDGSLYGDQCCMEGVVLERLFRVDSAGTFTSLHDFSRSAEGARPAAPLVEAPDGYLYGTTTAGGSRNRGTVFRMSRTGVVSVLHEFVGGAGDGAYPGWLVQATDGNLYGLTQGGGPQDRGTVFRLSPAGSFAMVYSFTGGADGSNPLQLIQATDGFLYGIAQNDGPFGSGTMFRLDPPGTPTLVHAFGSSPSDGVFPTALMQARDGSFYGFTLTSYSTAFRMLPDGTYIPLHTFNPFSEGFMVRTLVEGQDGNFYGATSCLATIFRMTPGGEVTVLSRQDNLNCDRVHAPFDNVSISLVPVPDGSFYGVRHRLRDSDDLFTMTSEGALTVLHTFTFAGDSGPASLIRTRNGNLYGTTFLGGPRELGTIFRFNQQPESIMFIDQPTGSQTVLEPFVMSGWALDATASADAGVDAIHVWAYPNPGSGQAPVFAGAAVIGRPRPDVAAYFGGDQFTSSGFEFAIRGLAPGPYQFFVFTHHTMTGSFDDARAVNVTIAPNAPMAIDQPLNGATVFGSVHLSGWAVDRAAVSGTGVSAVHVWAYPNPGSGQPPFFAGAAAYGGARPDVGAVFGSQFTNSAYDLTVNGLSPGDYQFVVFAYSTVSQTFLNALPVTVHAIASAAMAVDLPSDGATVSGPFTMSGWAIDRAATSGAGVDAVHVWAYPNSGSGTPVFLGSATFGGSRPDVGAIFGPQFTNSAFALTAPALAPGRYQLVVFARSRVTSNFDNARALILDVSK